MEKKYYKTISLKSWEDFIKDIASKTRLEWIFRGQSNADWDLKTSLERANIVSSFPSYEEEYLNEFKRGAKFYLKDEELPSTQLEWFSMIQHFGAPSRHLDHGNTHMTCVRRKRKGRDRRERMRRFSTKG